MEEFEDWIRAAPAGAVYKLADGTDRLRKLDKPRLVEYLLSVPELRQRALDSYAVEKRVEEWRAQTDPWERRKNRIRYGLVGRGTLAG